MVGREEEEESSGMLDEDGNQEESEGEAARESLDDDDILNLEKGGKIEFQINTLIIDEDVQGLLTELNDTAIQALLRSDDPANTSSNNNEHALECLKRGEQLLEAVTAEGKDVDRNLIIVILYNLGCTY